MISQAVCNSYKVEILKGIHKVDDEYKMALFTEDADLNKNTTTYTGLANELPDGNGYSIGGKVLIGKEVQLINDTAVLTFTSSPVWDSASFTARGAVIYNNTTPEKRTVAVFDFGQNYTANNQPFEVEFPPVGENTSLLRIV